MHPPKKSSPAPHDRRSSTAAGFSIIEGLIAALLLLVVTLGILPLFSRAMNNNVKGNDSTRQSNGATDAFETDLALPFNGGDTTIPAGSTSVVVTDTLALKKIASPSGGIDQALSTRWELPAALGSDDVPVMNRQRTLRQFTFDDFTDNFAFDTPLDGGFQPGFVIFKVVDISLQDATGGAAGAYRLRFIRSF